MLTIEQITDGVRTASREYPLRKVELFGSYATGKSTPQSDVDLLVEFVQPRVSLLTLNGLKYRMEELLGTPVDIVHGPAIGVSRRTGCRMDIVSAQYFDDPSVVELGRRPFVRGKIHLIGHITHMELSPILSLRFRHRPQDCSGRSEFRPILGTRKLTGIGQDMYSSMFVAQAVQIGFDGVLGSQFFHNDPFTGMDGNPGIAHGFLQLGHVHSVRIFRPGGQVDDLPGPLGNRPAIFILGSPGPDGNCPPRGLPGRRNVLHLSIHRMVSLPACFPAFLLFGDGICLQSFLLISAVLLPPFFFPGVLLSSLYMN